jgi:hypothetical protein
VIEMGRTVENGFPGVHSPVLTPPPEPPRNPRNQRSEVALQRIDRSMATSLLPAPAAYHRMVFTLKIKDHVVDVATKFAIAGMMLLVLAMTTGLLLVLDITLGHGFATPLAGLVIVWFCCWWYAVPMIKRMRHNGDIPARHKR